MNFTINLLKKDWIYLSVLLGLKRGMLKYILFFGIFFVVISLSDGARIEENFDIYYIIANILIFIIFMTAFYGVVYMITIYKIGVLLEKSPGQLGEKEITLTENSLKIKAELDEGTVQWQSFIEFIETDKYFILLNTTVSGIIIPKRELSGISEEVREFLLRISRDFGIRYKKK